MSKSSVNHFAAALLIGATALGMAAPGAWAATTSTSMSPQADARQSDHQITEAYAKGRILGDNYTNVTDVRQTNNGWTAKALESGKQVSLAVNDMGDVNKI
jgi:hypothetical protein